MTTDLPLGPACFEPAAWPDDEVTRCRAAPLALAERADHHGAAVRTARLYAALRPHHDRTSLAAPATSGCPAWSDDHRAAVRPPGFEPALEGR